MWIHSECNNNLKVLIWCFLQLQVKIQKNKIILLYLFMDSKPQDKISLSSKAAFKLGSKLKCSSAHVIKVELMMTLNFKEKDWLWNYRNFLMIVAQVSTTNCHS